MVIGPRLGLVLGLALTLVTPSGVHAGNGAHPRTPVLWEPVAPCMTIVDRNVSPKLAFTYQIPYEDPRPENAIDEVDNSRSHQFLAFCRGHSLQEPLPVWLSTADVEAAAALALVNPSELTPADILDTSPDWQHCLARITQDDERRPITLAAAAEPVVWDTTGLPIGAYFVNGYTWEPPLNIFSLRSGVVKIVDDPDPAASPPALAIRNEVGEDTIWETESLSLHGCVSSMNGSTLTGYWAQIRTHGMPLEWASFAADTPVVGDSFELTFTPPPGLAGNLVALKVEVADPLKRTMTAHMNVLASVLEGGPPSGETEGTCDSFTSAVDPDCETHASTASTSETTTLQQMPELGGGCAGCSAHRAGGTLGWLYCPVLLLLRRRRSEQPALVAHRPIRSSCSNRRVVARGMQRGFYATRRPRPR